jgi:branched-subunit amino acid transport protein
MSLEVNTSCLQEHKISQKSIWQIFVHELVHHLPYGTLSVSLALMLLSLITVLFDLSSFVGHHCHDHGHVHDICGMSSGLDILFHSFHFAHILFAASGTMVTFYRYSKNVMAGIIVGILSSVVFCTVADILLPYAAGRILGVEMDLHICFSSELANILPFLAVGVINGIIIPQGKEGHTEHHSSSLHFIHTFISAMASIFYAVGHGLANFHDYLGLFFVLMLITVVIPCTLSDVVVPVFWARMVSKK